MASRTMMWAALAATAASLLLLASAEAFWAARGPRGGVAVGAPLAGAFVRPPVVAGHYYAGGCLRCAPLYAPGAVAARVAIGAAAASRTIVVETAPAPTAPPPQAMAAAPPQAAQPTSAPSSAPPAQRAAQAQPVCASQLSAESRLIYNAARAAMSPSANLKDVITAQTRALVMSGKVQQASARASATSAGECLAQAQ